MVTKYGMSETLGPISFNSGSDEVFLGRDYNHLRNYSEAVASEIDDEINRIITTSYDKAKSILSEHIDKLHKVANRLLEIEKIDGEQFRELMIGDADTGSAGEQVSE